MWSSDHSGEPSGPADDSEQSQRAASSDQPAAWCTSRTSTRPAGPTAGPATPHTPSLRPRTRRRCRAITWCWTPPTGRGAPRSSTRTRTRRRASSAAWKTAGPSARTARPWSAWSARPARAPARTATAPRGRRAAATTRAPTTPPTPPPPRGGSPAAPPTATSPTASRLRALAAGDRRLTHKKSASPSQLTRKYEPAHLYPGYGKGQTYHHIIPHAGHMRLTAVSAPTFSTRSRPSVILAEMDRINHRLRPSLAYQPAEDFLNSRSIVSFDDEARAIRGQAAHLLKRIHTPVPRALRPLPVITTGYEYEELPLPPRITSDMYIQRLLGLRDVQHEVLSRSYYNEPASRANIVFPGQSRSTFVRGPRPVNSGYYRPTNDPGKEYAEALASAAVATANFNMHTAALEENRKNKQKREDARLASAAEERDKEGESATDGGQEPQSEQVQKKLEEEVKRKAEEEAKRKAEEEAKKKAEEEAKKKAEEEAKKKAEQEAKKKAEEEAKKKAEEEEAKKKAEEEAKKKAEEEAKKKAEEEAKKKAEEEAKKKAEEEAKKKAEEEAKKKAEEEEAKRKAEEEAKRKAEEEEAKKKAEEEEAKRKAEEEAKKKEEEEARIKAEEEEAKKKAEEEAAAAQVSEPAKGDDVDDIWAGVDEDMPRKKVVPEVAADAAEEEVQPAGEPVESKSAEEEQADQGPEPVVEEPTSPETPAPTSQPEIEEVPASEEE